MKLNIEVSNQRLEEPFLELIGSYESKGSTFWQKRNTIKNFEKNGINWNIKSFKIPHVINKFAYRYLRKSKARRSFEHAKKLIEKGVLTPEPLGYIEYLNSIGLGNSYYASRNLNYDFTFRTLYDDFPEREKILKLFTEFTFNLHENGVHHFDHSHGNTLIKKTNGGYDFYLIDLNRMVFEDMDYPKRIKNFQRLGLKDDMIPLIGARYAELIHEDKNKVINDIFKAREEFREFYRRKARWKKRIGLS